MSLGKRLINTAEQGAGSVQLMAATSSGLYYSNNDGVDWSNSGITGNFTSAEAIVHNGVNWVAVGLDGATYRSKYSADGLNWSNGTTFTGTSADSILYDSFYNKTYFCARGSATGNVYSSSNNGESFTSILTLSGGTTARVYSLGTDQAGRLVAGVRNNVYVSTNGTSFSQGLAVKQLIPIGYNNGRWIGASEVPAGIQYSDNNFGSITAATASNVYGGNGSRLATDGASRIVMAVNASVSTHAFQYSTNNGSSFSACSTPQTSNFGECVLYIGSNTYLAGTATQGVMRSTNAGVNFSFVNTNISGGVFDLALVMN